MTLEKFDSQERAEHLLSVLATCPVESAAVEQINTALQQAYSAGKAVAEFECTWGGETGRPSCNGHEHVYEDGSGYICRHCGVDMDDEHSDD